jgi:hypothetical protein
MRNSPSLKNFGMPTGLDEQYTWMALATLFGFVMIAWDLMVARKAELEGKTAKVIEPAAKGEQDKKDEQDKQDKKAVAATTKSDVNDDDEESDGEAQPMWRERLERRAQGKRRRRR